MVMKRQLFSPPFIVGPGMPGRAILTCLAVLALVALPYVAMAPTSGPQLMRLPGP
ncbi:MAG: hypothetical protein ETSY1_23950 [Candidatus Entotheonella factor]|uniref:Uncharacterized protein n=1 Tax=Entotheonella factor TaxID=1429438 RepID=W4LHA3_ENTF1|nr:MAG: hypothetical protein ETSY1_23950 [Candidatus Entotheonella factor]